MYSRFASKGQIDFALLLGAIEDEAEGQQMTKKAISRLIESAKQGYFQELCRAYDELDRDLQRSGDILGIAEKATTLRKQGYSVWHCGPCPECKGDDRFYVNTTDNLFKCGHAGGSGSGCGWGGGIAQLAAYVWKCSTWDAIDSLTGQSPRKEPVIRARKSTRAPIQAAGKAKGEKPYSDFSGVLQASMERLRAPDGQVARDWLAQRGIMQATWEVNRVGFCEDYRRGGAVCFPHELVIDGKLQVISLNRRFLDDEDRKAKLEAAKLAGKKVDIPKTKHVSGGRWGLYHLVSVSGARGLIVVEGEVNGLSVWQAVRAAGWLIDVASVGSEGAFKALSHHISELAKPYERLIIWADKGQVADDASKLINHHAAVEPIHSIVFEGKELDANDLLAINLLRDSLERVLPSGLSITGEEVATVPMPDVLTAPTFPVTQVPILPVTNDHDVQSELTASEELLGLCAELADSADDSDMARALYLEAERRYMWGDVTDLFEHYQKMSSQLAKQAKQLALLEV